MTSLNHIHTTAPPADAPPSSRSLRPLVIATIAGLAWWGIGFSSWILWVLFDVLPMPGNGDSPPRSALPVMPALIGWLTTCGLAGGLAAGAVPLVARGARMPAVFASLAGAVVALIATLAQSLDVVTSERVDAWFPLETWVTYVVIAVVVATMIGWVLGSLVALDRAWLGPALAAFAVSCPAPWALILFYSVDPRASGITVASVLSNAWIATLLAAAFVVIGGQTLRRFLIWLVVAPLAWVLSAVVSVVAALPFALQIQGQALMGLLWSMATEAMGPIYGVTPFIVALVIAALVTAVRAAGTRRPVPVPPA